VLAINVPVLVDANVTLQLDVVALTLANVHGLPVNEPAAVPVLENATVPAGALAVPAAAVSFTNAVQVIVWPTLAIVGEHVTAEVVGLRVTVTVLLAVGPLPL